MKKHRGSCNFTYSIGTFSHRHLYGSRVICWPMTKTLVVFPQAYSLNIAMEDLTEILNFRSKHSHKVDYTIMHSKHLTETLTNNKFTGRAMCMETVLYYTKSIWLGNVDTQWDKICLLLRQHKLTLDSLRMR